MNKRINFFAAYSSPSFLDEALYFHVVAVPVIRVACPLPFRAFPSRGIQEVEFSSDAVGIIAVFGALGVRFQIDIIP